MIVHTEANQATEAKSFRGKYPPEPPLFHLSAPQAEGEADNAMLIASVLFDIRLSVDYHR